MSHADLTFYDTDRFSIVRRIGAGGMGVVYEAFDRERNERVALKTLLEFVAIALYRFKQEFRNLSEILHPNLVPLYELIGDGDRWFFTMQLVERAANPLVFVRDVGDDAQSSDTDSALTAAAETRIANVVGIDGPAKESVSPIEESVSFVLARAPARGPTRGPAPVAASSRGAVNVARVRDVFRQLAEGVDALHAAGRLHRDLKPSNVLVTDTGRVVILDFGLVANLAASAPETFDAQHSPSSRQVYHSTDRALAGTYSFMSPQQAACTPLTPASAWYSFGLMLFRALTGRLPFEGPASDVIVRKQEVDPPAPSELAAGIPEDLDRLASALLRREPAGRPSAAEILAALGTPEQATAPAGAAMPALFVGRAAHLRELHECFRAMREGRTVVCHVSGRSGAGKSTLLSKFLESVVATEGAVALPGRCYEQESVPYKALDSLVDALARQ